jgi:hypothetical protein
MGRATPFPMSVSQLISLSENAWKQREPVLGLPGGELSPEEMAGDLIRRFGLETARALAAERAGSFPAPWNFYYQVHAVLADARDI